MFSMLVRQGGVSASQKELKECHFYCACEIKLKMETKIFEGKFHQQ